MRFKKSRAATAARPAAAAAAAIAIGVAAALAFSNKRSDSDPLLDRPLSLADGLQKNFTYNKAGCENSKYGPIVRWLITTDPTKLAEEHLARGDHRMYGPLRIVRDKLVVTGVSCKVTEESNLSEFVHQGTTLHSGLEPVVELIRHERISDNCELIGRKVRYGFEYLYNSTKLRDQLSPFKSGCALSVFPEVEALREGWP